METAHQLRARLQELFARDAALQRHFQGQDGRLEADFGDRASLVQGDEVLEQLDAAALTEIRDLREALRRLEQGSYGQCRACGQEIEASRLHLLPTTDHCRSCAA